ncbi:MAG: 4'-phosphopantetheinyl transferase superfamily protein [Bacteroidota bacterium]
MPLLRKKDISPGCSLAIWDIREDEEELARLAELADEDRAFLRQLGYRPRRLQWMASRILLRSLTGSTALKIAYDDFGKPFLRDSALRISISHSHGRVGLIASGQETGLDIEQVREKIYRIRMKFMSEAELKNIGAAAAHEQLTAYWCAKESLYKLYGKKELHFREHILIDDFEYRGSGTLTGRIAVRGFEQRYRLCYEAEGGFMHAFVLPGDKT